MNDLILDQEPVLDGVQTKVVKYTTKQSQKLCFSPVTKKEVLLRGGGSGNKHMRKDTYVKINGREITNQ